jgi:uncharacterized protein DUF3568
MFCRLGAIALLTVVVAAEGCAGVRIPFTGAGPAEQGVNYTLDGIAYRTFGVPVDQMRRATLVTFRRMDLALKSDDPADDGCRQMVATAGDRTVYVELEKLTERTTRMRTTAKIGWLWRDRTAAGDLIVQTARTLDGAPAVTQRTK